MRTLLAPLAALGFAGCSFAPVPPAVETVGIRVTSSASVRLHEPRFDMWDGHLDLRGVGYRTTGLEMPGPTHLDVAFLDAGGNTVRREQIALRFPPRSRFGPDMGKYRLHVRSLPPGTVRIDINADEQPHGGT